MSKYPQPTVGCWRWPGRHTAINLAVRTAALGSGSTTTAAIARQTVASTPTLARVIEGLERTTVALELLKSRIVDNRDPASTLEIRDQIDVAVAGLDRVMCVWRARDRALATDTAGSAVICTDGGLSAGDRLSGTRHQLTGGVGPTHHHLRATERVMFDSPPLCAQQRAQDRLAGLTVRQRQVMACVLDGHPSKNIAADLGISQRTVESHRAAIMRKTGVASIPELTRLAVAASIG